ncbi:sensor histidine kinase [Mycolicibacter hiberniae]|uniref:histidine kinase n=1 Tax=Mycolicibacter hiberniae TaxID=29314 RepID=A0A7I7WYD2_9MYCO|nr:sensor histidine kinase KdpD [Mycolicibacter hiberniae]MCV7086546.1 sensor histidine kinase KdpD [Mycolicibacter hiberniae]ORV69950.1 histidine kinase [Mycolicibacter hiberniae]BBZ22122.1 sensor protein KdpD [Mycolicibacter hiberniae]
MSVVSQRPRRGELRIYLGAAPGVGKTYAMLGEAHRRAERGTDVVAAAVQTHGRPKTAELLQGIEIVGEPGGELDLDAVLARHPQVVLVDDLAHTNPPGSRNAKRWQDIEELLDAGITVISTLDVQQLESLSDVAAKITGTPQLDTVPDAVVRKAEQIELIDIAPEALRRRLSHGNVYPPEKVDAALANYFRGETLTALRELALLWLAGQVDAALTRYRADKKITETWEARERIVAAVTGGSESEALVRRASRIASKAGGELLVLHVLGGDGLSGAPAPWVGKMRQLAISLGASLHTVIGDDVPTGLLEFARDVNATQLVIGSSRRSRWARIFDEGVGAAVVQHSGDIDVHIVTTDAARPGLRALSLSPPERRAISWLAAVVVPCLMCAVTVGLLDRYLETGLSALFFVGVLLVALLGGIGPAVLSALLSGVLLNYFLLAPRHDFTVAETDAAVTEVVLLLVAVAVAALVDSAANRSREAGRASREAELMTLFAGSVLRGADLDTLLERVRETYAQRSVSLVRVSNNTATTQVVASVGEDPCTSVDLADTSIDVGDNEFWMLMAGRQLASRDRRVLSVVARQAAGLVRQEELAAEADRADAVMRTDELRRSLLSAVSHDLRTPLAAAKAAVSSLRADDVDFSPADTAELLATVEESIDQLTDLVGNLLDSSRLAAGVVRPELTKVYLEEVVQRALVGIGKRSNTFGRAGVDQVKVDVGATVAMADAGLLERVLANVIDNALRYASDSVVRVTAGRVGDRVLINVADEGRGLPRGGEAYVFDPFQRLGDRDNTSGVGLGLSVARGFTEAMGGTISATETPGGGLTMVIDLAAPGGES